MIAALTLPCEDVVDNEAGVREERRLTGTLTEWRLHELEQSQREMRDEMQASERRLAQKIDDLSNKTTSSGWHMFDRALVLISVVAACCAAYFASHGVH
jgi:Flp pilus assembly protein TadB